MDRYEIVMKEFNVNGKNYRSFAHHLIVKVGDDHRPSVAISDAITEKYSGLQSASDAMDRYEIVKEAISDAMMEKYSRLQSVADQFYGSHQLIGFSSIENWKFSRFFRGDMTIGNVVLPLRSHLHFDPSDSGVAYSLATKLGNLTTLPRDKLFCLFSFIFTQSPDISMAIREKLRDVREHDPAFNNHLDFFLNSQGFLAWVADMMVQKLWSYELCTMAQLIRSRASKVFGRELDGRGSVVPKALEIKKIAGRWELIYATTAVVNTEAALTTNISNLVDGLSTTFKCQPQGGESSKDSGGEDHTVQIDHQIHDSVANIGSNTMELTSPAVNQTSYVTDQKPYQKFPSTTFGSKPYGEQSYQDSGGETKDLINQVDHQVHDSVTSSPTVLGPIAVNNSSSVVADQKPYKNLAIFPDKYGPDVGSTAFRSRPWGGEQSSPGGESEDHIIEAHQQGHDSDDISGSIQLASPALNNIPALADQSVRGSADGQPPPDRSPSDMERGEDPPQTVRLRNSSGVARLLNTTSVAKLFLVANSGVCLVPSQIRSNAGTTLSANANILLLCAELFGFAGFLSCCGAYIFQRRRRASRVMAVMGCVAAICGLLSIVGTRFPEKAMLWLTAALCILPISASPLALKEFV